MSARLLLTVLATALLLATVPAGAPAQTVAPTEIVVQGTGTVTMAPDVASVSVEIQTNSENASQAVGKNNATYERVAGALAKLNVARGDVSLVSYDVNYNPRPQQAPGEPVRPPAEIYGYTVTRDFTVKVRALENAGAVVDAATGAGATSIGGVSFGLSDDRAARARATANAVADARAKAEAIAAAAGLHVVGIRSFNLNAGGGVPLMRMAAAAPMAQPPTQFDTSGVGVTVSLEATFLASP